MLHRLPLRTCLLIVTLASFSTIAWSQSSKPLTEKDITSLLEVGIADDAIVARVEKGGLAFDADEATIERLKKANASDAVLKAIQKAADSKKTRPAADGKPAITYEAVLKLVELGIAEESILKHIENSPTLFTLGDAQTAELKRAGASDRLLRALAGERAAPAPKGDVTDFAIVLDCSGSMAEKTSDGQTKMAAAHKVVGDLVERIPDGLRLTFVIYGHDKQLDCRAVKILRPLGPIDAAGKSQLISAIRALRPTGNTPIALGLRTAGKELMKNDAYCGMVLVSDGKEMCNGDPVAEAAALAKNDKLNFGIHVVGFDVLADERKSLEQIAAAGKGKYFDPRNAEELAESLDVIAKELKERAKPPKVRVNRRILEIVAPKIEMPELKEVYLVTEDAPLGTTISSYRRGAAVQAYGKQINVPSNAKYDVVFVPKKGSAVKMMTKFSIPEPELVQIKPEEHLGLVKVEGEGVAKNIFVVPTGSPQSTAASYAIQRTDKFGEIMIVPPGEYDVYVNNELIQEKFKVEPGKLHEL